MFEFVKKLTAEKLQTLNECDCMKNNQFTTSRGVYNIYLLRHKETKHIWYLKLKDETCVELINISELPPEAAKKILSKPELKSMEAKKLREKDPEAAVVKTKAEKEKLARLMDIYQMSGVSQLPMSKYQKEVMPYLFELITDYISCTEITMFFPDGSFIDYRDLIKVATAFLSKTKMKRAAGVKMYLSKYQQAVYLTKLTSLTSNLNNDAYVKLSKKILNSYIDILPPADNK